MSKRVSRKKSESKQQGANARQASVSDADMEVREKAAAEAVGKRVPSITDAARSQSFEQYTSFDEFTIKGFLGTGSFGRVMLCQHKKTERHVAVKELNKAYVVKRKQTMRVMNERRSLRAIRSPFVVRLYGTFHDDLSLYFVLEFCQGGELFSRIRTTRGLPIAHVRFYAAEVVLAVDAMHKLDIVYRDLKPENVLIDADGHIRLVDLGFAQQVPYKSWSICGTPEYMAPEMILGRGAGKAADWWSVGILIYEMIAARPPFRRREKLDLYRDIIRGEVVFSELFEEDAKDLIRGLLSVDDAVRLGATKEGTKAIKKHEFFESIDFKTMKKKKGQGPWLPAVKDIADSSAFDLTGQDTSRKTTRLTDLPDVDPHMFDSF